MAGDEAADLRQDLAEIPTIKISQKAFRRLGKFEYGNGATGFEYPLNFAQAGFVVGKVAEAESAGDEIEGRTDEGQVERVCLNKRHRWRSGQTRMAGDALAFGDFGACAHEHGVREIGADDAGRAHTSEREGEITCSAAEIEDQSVV